MKPKAVHCSHGVLRRSHRALEVFYLRLVAHECYTRSRVRGLRRWLRSTLAADPFAESGAPELREQLIADDLDGLVRELLLDQVNGLQGKTVIHPSHVAVVHAMSVVTHEDFCDASDVVRATAGGVMASSYRNKMNEAGPHRPWAERVLARARAFGVARPDVSYAHLLQAQDAAVAVPEGDAA